MIYTVTFNPALDYVVTVNHFTPGRVNRTIRENIFYGGKGINVSALLANLGYQSTALGFVAGFTGDEIERGVKKLGFQSDFIKAEKGMSRINVKLKSDEESEINGMGPEITAGDVKALFEKLSHLEQGDVLVLSGSIPACVDEDIYERIMEMLDGRGIRIVVDAEKDLLLNWGRCSVSRLPRMRTLQPMQESSGKWERSTYWYPWQRTGQSLWRRMAVFTDKALPGGRSGTQWGPGIPWWPGSLPGTWKQAIADMP